MSTTRKDISDTVRDITRNALTHGKLDRAAVRRVTEDFRDLERLLLKTMRETARAGKGAASQGMSATLASGAMVARIASGMLAGIADSLAQKKPRRPR